MLQKLSQVLEKVRSTKLVAGFAVVAAVAAFSANGVALASPNYMDVEKPNSQRICYKQLGEGWKALGFKSLDHCLRYVSTDQPEEREDCEGGWWYVYGFNNQRQCVKYVADHGGGYGATVR
ncbi:MAG TPA: hypothetical protein VD907_03205 [Verrucomicrobiae bacterium]|nr:hypothetical protein [Verrucomicrobiae bacterium]